MKHGHHSPKEMARIKKAMQHPDKPGAGAKARKHIKGKAKVGVVMREFKRGTLRSGSGAKVKSKKQAIAIALSEARRSGAKIPIKPIVRGSKRSLAQFKKFSR